MNRPYDLELGEVGFIAVEPCDAKMFRRAGVLIWARRTSDGFRLLSVQESEMISVTAAIRPPDADALLVSPPIGDGRRRSEVRAAVHEARLDAPRLLAAE